VHNTERLFIDKRDEEDIQLILVKIKILILKSNPATSNRK